MFNHKKKLEEQEEILAYLEALLGCVKTLNASMGTVMTDVAAMRSVLLGDPEEAAQYQSKLKALLASDKLMMDDAKHYDDWMEEIVASQRYTN